MKGPQARYTLLLAWRYLSYHRVRSCLLAASVGLMFLLPLAVNMLVDSYSEALAQRAQDTPLIAGAQGSRYDLVLDSLYFKGRVPRPTTMAEVDSIQGTGLAQPIPLLSGYKASGHPIMGTTPDYFGFRRLRFAAGTRPLFLGDVVLGAAVARSEGLAPGGHLLTDQDNLYDLAKGYPLRMKIVGVLASSGGPDDHAVFVDIKTAWIIAGIGHGHGNAEKQDEDHVMSREGGEITLNAAVVEYNEITPDNIDSFHIHAAPEDLPVTGVLLVPRSDKAATLLKGRYRVAKTAQLLVPGEVVDELLGFVFRVKVFFDANVILVSVATCLFLVLIVLLSLRVRNREMETLFKIGCARATVFHLMTSELSLVLAFGLIGAGALASVLVYALKSGAGIF